MMLSASPTSLARSSLEEMLDSLRRQDECEKPKDLPPALPARPTSKARLPSARRSLPAGFNLSSATNIGGVGNPNGRGTDGVDQEAKGKEEFERKEKALGARRMSFGSKKLRIEHAESPYVAEAKTDGTEGVKSSAVFGPAKNQGVKRVPESEWNDNIAYFIRKKLRVWCRVPNRQWESGMIQSTSGEEAFVQLSDGSVVKVSTEELFPANPEILQGIEDLRQLSYLNEPSVLDNLRKRYARDMIYSKAGPVLIAVNPFKHVQLCGNDFVSAYRNKAVDSPHVYAVADIAYHEMMRDDKNQSIIINGESGAGKTETAKLAMQYLAALGGGGCGVEYEVLKTNCILEAFGNAKTSRNDNSSRFGKLIDIHFSTLGKICGAKIQTFLLEKSRVVQLSDGERSYHIFYQLCAGASSILRERLKLKTASEYYYLNQSDCLVIDGVDDAQKFNKLMEAFDAVQISKEDQERVFAMLAAVLWLGNISFQVIDNDNHVEVLADEAVTNAAMLIGCSAHNLMGALSNRNLQAGRESIAKQLTLRQAIDTRDALAKLIYASLFDWLVEQINKSLEVGKQRTGRSINILDIYGFESFKNNSFEQFFINYANERLQQHFNRHLFKLEQEEYEMDGIDWIKVEFEDNQECLDLFEKKPLGLLSLLDEESNFPKATDLTLANKLKQHPKVNSCFRGERGRAFRVNHYAGEVLYDTNGFLEKNRDPLPADLHQLLSSCNCLLPQLFSAKINKQPQKPASVSESTNQSVGIKFKGQLFKLMNQLESTTPHFIRCIKPNSKQLPGIYEEDLVLQQLRCCGILEVVRISRSGYPTRMTHQEFARRYGFLLMGTNLSQDPLSISIAILQQFNVPPEMYQIGYTKLYLRAGQISALEDRRKQVLQGILGIQKWFRGGQDRRNFCELKRGAITLQSFVRGENARRKYAGELKVYAASALRAVEELEATIYVQSVIRGWLARRQLNNICHLKLLNSEKGKSKKKPGKRIFQEQVVSIAGKKEPKGQVDVPPLALGELQSRVLKAEKALGQKEEENIALREQLQQYEKRWAEYEVKMKSMEEMWQKQMASLQMSLAAARKSLAADGTSGQPGRLDNSPSPRCYDSEDATSSGTPGTSTPTKLFANGTLHAVNNLAQEFEQRRQNFDEDARSLAETKTANSSSVSNPDEELKKLKLRFETWKKDYKARLRETKARLREKGRRRWWGGKKRV